MQQFLYNDFSTFLRRQFGCKVQKISIDAGFTCPNRDGTKGRGGCTYCNNQTFRPEYCKKEKTVREQLEEGRVFFDESRPRTISTVDRRDDIETISRRICLEMADGGKLYMDCHLQKPRAAPVSVCFDGILDAKSMRGKIGQVVGCTASCD